MAKIKRSIDFTAQQLKWLEKEAKRLGLTLAEVVRRIVDRARGE